MKTFSNTMLSRLRNDLFGQNLIALAVVGLITLLASALNAYLPYTSLLLLFMTGVVMVSSQTSLGPSILCSVLSFLSFNFFFTEPYYTLDVIHRSDIAALFLFLLVSIMTGNLASKMRQAISRYDTALSDLHHFYEFSQKMTSALNKEGVLALLQKNVQSLNDAPVSVICRNRQNEYEAIPSHGGLPDKALLDSLWNKGMPYPVDLAAGWTFIEATFNKEVMAVIAIKGRAEAGLINSAQTLADLAALALQRIKLFQDLEQAKLTSETEQLRSALLSSVSHDLRTPLASVIGSASTLLDLHDQIDQEKQQTLLSNILHESERLDRHIQNLLDMTRFGQGKVSLKRDWVDMQDIISSVLSRLSDVLKNCQVSVHIAETSPIISVHGLLIEQALLNIIDNAARFNSDDGRISISLYTDPENMIIDVEDEGPGIANDEKKRIFDMFYSLNQGDQHQRAGAGLGLAIAQGMVGAHGGQIEALDRDSGKGALMRVTLPWAQTQQNKDK